MIASSIGRVDTDQETFESLQWPHTERKKREAIRSGNMSSYGVHFTSLYGITPVTGTPRAQNRVLHGNTACPLARQANTKQRRRDDQASFHTGLTFNQGLLLR